MTLDAALRTEPSAPRERALPKRYLFGPFADFLCLGGSSLLILPLLLLLPEKDYQSLVLTAVVYLSILVNYPHFACSYVIFYRGFRANAFTGQLGRAMQARYVLAGVVVPLALAAFFAGSILAGNAWLLGHGGNIMALFVGWHYVKQGYGMLMLDAALKRRFYEESEKKALLVNAYAVWIAAWIQTNAYLSTHQLFGIRFQSFDLPEPVMEAANLAALATSLVAAWAIAAHWRRTRSLLFNGVIAYGVSLYAWRLFLAYNPLWVLVVPALHSLQYLAVVGRFELNYERAQVSRDVSGTGSILDRFIGRSLSARVAAFAAGGVALGFLMFFVLPVILDALLPYDRQAFGGMLFMFVSWVFINVHHYFIDSVMWRRENPSTRRYLFG